MAKMTNTVFKDPTAVELYRDDLPDGLDFGLSVAVDTETQGLNPHRDRLCVAQFSSGDGVCHLVQFSGDDYSGPNSAPNLKALLVDPKVTKIFHFARFDVAVFKRRLDVTVASVYCTKIASKLIRTYTDRHGLKDVSRELLGLDLSKQQQSSDWAAADLSPEQLHYAASDVLNLHAIKAKLEAMLEREGRTELADACFRFLPVRAELDLAGWAEIDVFSHS